MSYKAAPQDISNTDCSLPFASVHLLDELPIGCMTVWVVNITPSLGKVMALPRWGEQVNKPCFHAPIFIGHAHTRDMLWPRVCPSKQCQQ